MIVRKEGFGAESRRASLARRLEAVAGIRKREFAQMSLVHRRADAARFITIDPHPHGQDAA